MGLAVEIGYTDATGFHALGSSAGLAISSDLTLDPTNLATSAKQDTAQTSLTAIAAALGAKTDAAWDGSAASASVVSLLKAIALNTAT